MPEIYLKIIPTEPGYVPKEEARTKAVALLRKLLPRSEDWNGEVHERLEFIDQGEHLETIICPSCGDRLRLHSQVNGEDILDWWYRVSDEMEETGPEEVRVEMPCCRQQVPAMALTFDGPAGFARFEMNVMNPGLKGDLPSEHLARLEEVVGCRLRLIWAQY
jgi:hypothetical protein